MPTVSAHKANTFALITYAKPLIELSPKQMREAAATLNVSMETLRELREETVARNSANTDLAGSRSTSLRNNSTVTDATHGRRNATTGPLSARMSGSTARRASPEQIDNWAKTRATPPSIVLPAGVSGVALDVLWLEKTSLLGGGPRVQVRINGDNGHLLDVRADGSFGIEDSNNVTAASLNMRPFDGYPRLDGFVDHRGVIHITKLELAAPPKPPTPDWRTLVPPRTNRNATHAQIQEWTRHHMVSAYWPDQLTTKIEKGALVDHNNKPAAAVNMWAEWGMDGVPAFRIAMMEEPLLWDEPITIGADGKFNHQGENFTARGSVKGDGRVVFDHFAYRGFDGNERRSHKSLEIQLPALSARWDGNDFAHKVPEYPAAWSKKLDASTSATASWAASVRLGNSRNPSPSDKRLDVKIVKEPWGNQSAVFSSKDLGVLLQPAQTLADRELRITMMGSTFSLYDQPQPNGDLLSIHGEVNDQGWFTINRMSLKNATTGAVAEMKKGAVLVGDRLQWRP